ncbi:anti-sigma-28 factor, FlgM family [Alkalispirochaeta americana]|uniref:Anti-sigma-28 factor, FlgM family n=1 Tax=Alkalispirochaeta americana TaxID=159291 RepID=A0A1N6V6T6_9SPIO|nr:flagellar biosynthesis anti-sigma factor FlgM [Alkalispirochaeta americana]SIQ73593.1 anti-sigma-28 factor, FlgM family [Alkalispirochaeta americana]
MTIERLGPIDPIHRYHKAEKAAKSAGAKTGDAISLSDEARARSEVLQALEEVRGLPDIRQDRVEEVRRKLEDPSYISDKVVEAVAEEILSVFDLG